MDPSRRLGEIECLAMLDHDDTAHLAMSRHALPVIEPVHYRRDGHNLVITADHLEPMVEALRRQHVVCLEIDGPSEDGHGRWVVQITGPLTAFGDGHALDLSTAMISGDLRPWPYRPPLSGLGS